MLRIFGCYKHKGCLESLIPKMKKAFISESPINDYIIFSQNSISIIFEKIAGSEAKYFYHIDHDNQTACFIVGNIHAFENSSLSVLTGQNIAKFIIDEYKNGYLNFAQHLRGSYNIAIIDKHQLFLINDRFGLSSMYFHENDDGFFFCNHPEPIIWTNKNNFLDYESISEFIVYGFIPSGKTFVKNLYNQHPSTILTIKNNKVSLKRYLDSSLTDFKSLSEKQKFQSVNDVFQESVNIRINNNNKEILFDLSGGWDSRFILAHLNHTNKKLIAFTKNRNNSDLEIAKRIIKNKNIEHYVQNSSEDHNYDPRYFLDLSYRNAQTTSKAISRKEGHPKNYSFSSNHNILTLQKFSGLYGGELFGNIPDWFSMRIQQDFSISAIKLLSKKLQKIISSEKISKINSETFNLSQSPVFLFISQIGRSYLNVHYPSGWERPTASFSYNNLLPYTDSKFISLLCALEYNSSMNYRLYEAIYKKYYPEFLEFPWTSTPFRRNNDITPSSSAQIQNDLSYKNLSKNKSFISFLKNQNFIEGEDVVKSRLKELFFLFYWLDIYKNVLNPLDMEFCMGKTL